MVFSRLYPPAVQQLDIPRQHPSIIQVFVLTNGNDQTPNLNPPIDQRSRRCIIHANILENRIKLQQPISKTSKAVSSAPT